MRSKRKTVTRTRVGGIDHCTFLRSSASGNPRAEVTFRDGSVAKTEVDGQVGYGIDNRDYREGDCAVTYDLGTGNIVGIRRIDNGRDDRATGVVK